MNTPTCPTCFTPGVTVRANKSGRGTHLAYVQTYPSGASYFRGLHTREECAASLAAFNARVSETVAAAQREERIAEAGRRAIALTARYGAIYGPEATQANWDALYARWLRPAMSAA